jgi:putative hydrolase of the HAD superfamily
MDNQVITALFLDIGGVLLTNGWDHIARRQAAQAFHLDYDELEERHHLSFDTYEEGKYSLDEYLQQVVFNLPRSFTLKDFKSFMLSRSRPFPDMLDLVQSIKSKYGIKTVAVSNEGREINAYRIQTFHLDQLIDTFVSSCYVHYRKPDPDIYRIALDISQSTPDEVIYIDDRPLFVEVAKNLGIHGIIHHDYKITRKEISAWGLSI